MTFYTDRALLHTAEVYLLTPTAETEEVQKIKNSVCCIYRGVLTKLCSDFTSNSLEASVFMANYRPAKRQR